MASKWTEERINTVSPILVMAKLLGFTVDVETDTEATYNDGTAKPYRPIEEACPTCKSTLPAHLELTPADCRRYHEVQARYLGYKKLSCPNQFIDESWKRGKRLAGAYRRGVYRQQKSLGCD